ncbi:DUF3102 domain-containing protein [Microbulbifer sp. OS29]|uniref:DUF3102 domain-containing protein n=1 Tax=Microbulbifer okhotskensis TaxID=2926617 RepID=A0A9X2J641_9GAMM|nr:DUF3102 domain-containing protein [Microbulbifer okhotskensis]MCO1336237.1 DUF3102 domain-containing protein [Microbulbifer okhotskensis]
MSRNAIIEHQAHSREITELYLDGQPYDRLRLVNEARFCLAQSAEAMLEAGRRLIVIKEHEPRGELQQIIEQELGLNQRVAQRMMQAAAKFLSPKLGKQSKALVQLGKTKLYELMLEDDEELAELADGGTVAGLNLDDIDRMSTRELRLALRDARADNEAKDSVIADKNKKLDELVTKKKRIKKIPPDQESEQIRAEAADHCYQVEALLLGQVVQALTQVKDHADIHQFSVDSWMAGQLDQLEDALQEVRQVLGVFRSESAAPWEEESEEEVAA